MKLFITVKTNAKKEGVIEKSGTEYVISVKAPAKEGKANEAVIKAMARHLGCAQSHIRIIRGTTGKKKVLEVG
jgi:uncharacterized protein (TIGR00251 family)